VACAAALGSFEEIENHHLIDRAQHIGDLMIAELRTIAASSDVIGEIRGRGAMIAIELVTPGGRTPNRDAVAAVSRHCLNNGVLVLTAGTFGNVLRFLPPLSISDELLTDAFGVLSDAFATL
jgi:4-aminobutyrate aminotransferase/(S)-3-amino-2-methylpropionate transaminase